MATPVQLLGRPLLGRLNPARRAKIGTPQMRRPVPSKTFWFYFEQICFLFDLSFNISC